jgi:hypothetical protein
MTRRVFSLGSLLVGVAAGSLGVALGNSASDWISPPVASAAPGFQFHYLFPPMSASPPVTEVQRYSYAEWLEASVKKQMDHCCDLYHDEYFKCQPDENTEVVQLTDGEPAPARRVKVDGLHVLLFVKSKTAHGGNSLQISECVCGFGPNMTLGKCVARAIDKFSIALKQHRDTCHLPGKTCE